MVFLFHWPRGRTALISAGTLQDVYQIVDSVGDPSLCTFSKFDKPFCITFQPQKKIFLTREEELESKISVPDPSAITKDYRCLLEDGLYADVTVEVAGSHKFKCHRAVLALRCSYFKAMFDSGMEEASKGHITLDLFDKDLMKVVLHYLYTGELKLETYMASQALEDDCASESQKPSTDDPETHRIRAIYDILTAADFFNIPELQEHCMYEVLQQCQREGSHAVLLSAAELLEAHAYPPLAAWLCVQVDKRLDQETITEEEFESYPESIKCGVWKHRNTFAKPPLPFGQVGKLLKMIQHDLCSDFAAFGQLSRSIDPHTLNSCHVLHQLCQELCCRYRDEPVRKRLCEALKFLVCDCGCNINSVNSKQGCESTLLSMAASYMNHELIDVLQFMGARPVCSVRGGPREALTRAFSEELFKIHVEHSNDQNTLHEKINDLETKADRTQRSFGPMMMGLELMGRSPHVGAPQEELNSEIIDPVKNKVISDATSMTFSGPMGFMENDLLGEVAQATFPHYQQMLRNHEILGEVFAEGAQAICSLNNILVSELRDDWNMTSHKGEKFFSRDGLDLLKEEFPSDTGMWELFDSRAEDSSASGSSTD